MTALACPGKAQDPAPAAVQDHATSIDRLLVCNKADHSVSIFDPTTRKELATLPTGKGPHEVAISPDGRTAVVSDYGDQEPGRTLTVIDVVAAKVLRTIQLDDSAIEVAERIKNRVFLRPHGSAFVDGTHLVVTAEQSRALIFVDLTKGVVERELRTPQTTMHMVSLSPDRKHAFATSVREGNVAIFDLAGATMPRIVACGQGSEGLAVNPATGEAWVANRAANSVSIVDPGTGKVTKELPTGDLPFRVTFAKGGARALIPCAESGEVYVFDAKEKKLLQAISISRDGSEQSPLPMGITVDPDDHFAYVACGRGEFVAVLDLREGKVIDRIVSRAGPDGIGYARIAAESPRK
jgi:YVTN family beta-propeller protein